MCGITGFFSFKDSVDRLVPCCNEATQLLKKRGPDNQAVFVDGPVGLGHARLSILDTSAQSHQPMRDPSGRFVLIFNGEIFNFKELSKELTNVDLETTSDTEVLLQLLIQHGKKCLEKLNGFFALAFYDKVDKKLLLARDRMGIKPLHFYHSDEFFVFGSEMKALMAYPIPRNLDEQSLFWYLKLNYLPAERSMLLGVRKLAPGHYLEISKQRLSEDTFFESDTSSSQKINYQDAQSQLIDLLDRSIKRRLIADVPLGSFLSGGTDSSVIVALASRHTKQLRTFSVGYRDHSFFDETQYAELVAKKFNTEHKVFSLTNDDLLSDLSDIIDYIDEPFADSSAIPTYILAKQVRKHVTVALSGDGADELFGGYYKHMALNRSLGSNFSDLAIRGVFPLTKHLRESRSGRLSNLIRRINRYGTMQRLSDTERYWFLASLTNDPSFLMKRTVDKRDIEQYKTEFLGPNPDLEAYLNADQRVLLPGDMLTKVDLMSMANSLEVRVPFLDKEVVNFARSLPANFKVQGSDRKKILQDAFREILPEELYHRPKKGFEVPLLQWMRNELLKDLDTILFNEKFIQDQGLFHSEAIMSLRKKLLSTNPGDVHGVIWALYIFQCWHIKYIT